MTKSQKYPTLADAIQQLDGYSGWVWGGQSSYADWCRYARQHATIDDDDDSSLLAAYLRSVGESPADYGVREG